MSEEPRTEPVEPEPIPDELPRPEGSVDQPTVEAPVTQETPVAGESGPPPWEPPASSATAPIPSSPPARSGVFVPKWLLLAVGGVLLLGLGFAAGHAVGSDSDHAERRGEFSFNLRGRPPFPGDNRSPLAPTPRDGNGNRNGNNGSGPRPAPSATVYLGVAVRDSSDPAGAELARVVPASPAADAGLRAGDVVTALDSTSIKSAAQLTRSVRGRSAGDQVSVTYTRDGSSNTVKVRLATRPQLPRLPQQ